MGNHFWFRQQLEGHIEWEALRFPLRAVGHPTGFQGPGYWPPGDLAEIPGGACGPRRSLGATLPPQWRHG